MLRFIVWMIILFIIGKIVGQMIRYIRKLTTPNKNVFTHKMDNPFKKKKSIEDIPYEEVKENNESR